MSWQKAVLLTVFGIAALVTAGMAVYFRNDGRVFGLILAQLAGWLLCIVIVLWPTKKRG